MLPKTVVGRLEFISGLIADGLIDAEEALDLFNFVDVPEEVKNSPLWKAMNEKKDNK